MLCEGMIGQPSEAGRMHFILDPDFHRQPSTLSLCGCVRFSQQPCILGQDFHRQHSKRSQIASGSPC